MDSKKTQTKPTIVRRHPVLIELPEDYIQKLDALAVAGNRKRKAQAEFIVMQQLDAMAVAAAGA